MPDQLALDLADFESARSAVISGNGLYRYRLERRWARRRLQQEHPHHRPGRRPRRVRRRHPDRRTQAPCGDHRPARTPVRADHPAGPAVRLATHARGRLHGPGRGSGRRRGDHAGPGDATGPAGGLNEDRPGSRAGTRRRGGRRAVECARRAASPGGWLGRTSRIRRGSAGSGALVACLRFTGCVQITVSPELATRLRAAAADRRWVHHTDCDTLSGDEDLPVCTCPIPDLLADLAALLLAPGSAISRAQRAA